MRPSQRQDAPEDLATAIAGGIKPLELPPQPDVRAVVAWLSAAATTSGQRLQLQRIFASTDFAAVYDILALAWSRKVMAARARAWQSGKRFLLELLRGLLPLASEVGGAVLLAPLRDAISLAERAAPIVGAPVLDPPVVDLDPMLDSSVGVRRGGRPHMERNQLDLLLRDAGISRKADRRLLLLLLGLK